MEPDLQAVDKWEKLIDVSPPWRNVALLYDTRTEWPNTIKTMEYTANKPSGKMINKCNKKPK